LVIPHITNAFRYRHPTAVGSSSNDLVRSSFDIPVDYPGCVYSSRTEGSLRDPIEAQRAKPTSRIAASKNHYTFSKSYWNCNEVVSKLTGNTSCQLRNVLQKKDSTLFGKRK